MNAAALGVALTLRYAARSDVGLLRDGNEDSGYASPHLLVVADGMGGAAAGEVASSVAVAALAALDEDEPTGDLLEVFGDGIRRIEDQLGGLVDAEPGLRGMGTTLTAVVHAEDPGWAWSTSATRAATSCAVASSNASPATTRWCSR